MTTSQMTNELLIELKDKKYRDAFVVAHIDNGIPFQIKIMRERRGLTQEELANIAHKKQEAICRLENPNYGKFTLNTLKEIASALDVALIVRFAPFSDLVRWDNGISPDTLNVPSFDEDLYFQEEIETQKLPINQTVDKAAVSRSNILDISAHPHFSVRGEPSDTNDISRVPNEVIYV